MTHQQQADELVERFYSLQIDFPYTDTEDGACVGTGQMTYKSAVKFALIAVEEIIKALNDHSDEIVTINTEYWQAVKDELNRL